MEYSYKIIELIGKSFIDDDYSKGKVNIYETEISELTRYGKTIKNAIVETTDDGELAFIPSKTLKRFN